METYENFHYTIERRLFRWVVVCDRLRYIGVQLFDWKTYDLTKCWSKSKAEEWAERYRTQVWTYTSR